jgi:TLC domain
MFTSVLIPLSWIVSMASLSAFVSYRISRYEIRKPALTTGQITAAICQFVFSIWAFLNMIIYTYRDITDSTWQIEAYLIGFYIYDLFHLLTYKEGRKLYIFHLHHIVAVVTLIILQEYPEVCPDIIINTILFVLETSSLGINITVLYKQFATNYIQTAELINVIIYGATRIIAFPSLIYTEIHNMYVNGHLGEPPFASVAIIMTLLHILCMVWFQKMLTNFYERYIYVTHSLESQPL